jgi:hypothetical protein
MAIALRACLFSCLGAMHRQGPSAPLKSDENNASRLRLDVVVLQNERSVCREISDRNRVKYAG